MAELTYRNGQYTYSNGEVWNPFVSVEASSIGRRQSGRTVAPTYTFPGITIPVPHGRGTTSTGTYQDFLKAGYQIDSNNRINNVPNTTKSGKTIYDIVADQIADQRKTLGTEKYYTGSIADIGGIDGATRYMADRLVNSGIYNISDIGERTIQSPDAEGVLQTQKQIFNKRTGEPLKSGDAAGYYYANSTISSDQNSYIFGGSFAGDNTSLNISMVNGQPVFYTTPGPSSATFSLNKFKWRLALPRSCSQG